jgi:hypothetical protein
MMEEINSEIRNRNVRYYSIAEDANSVGGYSGHWEISFHNVLFPRLLPLETDGSLPADHRRKEVSVPMEGGEKFLRLKIQGP